jgi:acyl carrier protein
MVTTIDLKKVKTEIKALVAKTTGVAAKDLKDSSRFSEDLGIDSMMALEIVAAIEKKYKVIIPEEKLPTIRSMANIYNLMADLLIK